MAAELWKNDRRNPPRLKRTVLIAIIKECLHGYYFHIYEQLNDMKEGWIF